MSVISESSVVPPFAPRPTDIIVALMGMVGSGKSTFISHLIEEDLGIIGHGLQGFTQAVNFYVYPYSKSVDVYLVDTPGFDDTNLTDGDILRTIGTWLGKTYSRKILLNGIIYLHRITDPRMQGSARKNLFIFKKLCGEDALKHVTLVSTMWDAVHADDGERRERELLDTPDFWGFMREKGADVERHYNTRESAMKILKKFVQKEYVITSLQKELVDGGKKLLETEAGIELNSDFYKLEQHFTQERQRTFTDLQQAIAENDTDAARELERYQRDVDEKVAQILTQREQLKMDLDNMIAATDFVRARARDRDVKMGKLSGLNTQVNVTPVESMAPSLLPCGHESDRESIKSGWRSRSCDQRHNKSRPATRREMFKGIIGRGPRIMVEEEEKQDGNRKGLENGDERRARWR